MHEGAAGRCVESGPVVELDDRNAPAFARAPASLTL
jgi:hypothetical protein